MRIVPSPPVTQELVALASAPLAVPAVTPTKAKAPVTATGSARASCLLENKRINSLQIGDMHCVGYAATSRKGSAETAAPGPGRRESRSGDHPILVGRAGRCLLRFCAPTTRSTLCPSRAAEPRSAPTPGENLSPVPGPDRARP